MNTKDLTATTLIITSVTTLIITAILLQTFTGLTATLTVAAVLYTQYRIISHALKKNDTNQAKLPKQPTITL